MIALSSTAAIWFAIALVPLCLITVWTDLTRMKIPNRVTDLMFVFFIPLGLIALPLDVFLWQFVNPAVALMIGIIIYAVKLIGAGDIKFIVAASPYVMRPDLYEASFLLGGFLVAGAITHRVLRATIGPKLAPNWKSWHDTKRYPMGFSLGPALLAYLALAIWG